MQEGKTKKRIPKSLLVRELKSISRDLAREGDSIGALCIHTAMLYLLSLIRESKRRSG